MNFMDYTNDACMNSFSEGQKDRVWSAIYNFRNTLLSSTACSPPISSNSDAGIAQIIYPNNQNIDCANPIYPIVIIKNFGTTILNTAVIKYQINSGTYQYQYWNGNLLPNEMDTVLLAGIGGNGISNIFTATTQSPNNSSDINTSNDAQNIVYSSVEGRRIELRLTTDNYANETSWLLMNQNGTLIDSSNNLSNNTLYQYNYCLPSDCYYFVVNDAYGDGFCCSYGNGNYNITLENSNTILASGNQFAFSDTSYFCVNSVAVTEIIKNYVLLYPNPTSGKLWIKNIFTNENRIIFVNLFNGLGKLVMQTTFDNNNPIDLSHLKEGIYVLNFQNNDKHYSKKIIIQNR